MITINEAEMNRTKALDLTSFIISSSVNMDVRLQVRSRTPSKGISHFPVFVQRVSISFLGDTSIVMQIHEQSMVVFGDKPNKGSGTRGASHPNSQMISQLTMARTYRPSR
ncbi:hypothetical protein PoB_007193700 [Plakobranchus ocellatus]|uniref:Uncharacterized protein n=1 Tax=Plakobranchus ocellatus TaxID=259542 RepID=A0AAV4DME0_9GAST|nr:hypothetical protein PoB_007193700 [Plakobranchus ocellatus]